MESIVIGCRRRGHAARALLGSTSRSVLRSSSVPVIVTNPHIPYDIDTGPDTGSVAVPAELDPHARSESW